MRLLLVNYEYPPVGAGAATATQALAFALVRLGHSASVLTGAYKNLPAQSEKNGVYVRRVPSLRRRPDRSGIVEMLSFLVSAEIALPFIIRARKIDGIIAFFSLPDGPVGLTGRILCRIPYVVSLRGGDVPGTEWSLTAFHRLLAPLRRIILRQSRAITAPSEGLKKLSEQIDPFPVRVIPNGVDTNIFTPKPVSEKRFSGPFRFLFVGRIRSQKNLGWLFEQLQKLRSGGWTIDLVGDGPDRAKMEALSRDLGLASVTKWKGWISRDELPAMYRNYDCLVNPSLYEGMPNAVLEAMGSGLPVIASRVAGNIDLVLNGETGYLCDLQSSSEFVGALQQLIDDPARAAQFGAAGRARVSKEFSWDNIAQQYAALFETVSR
jgi:glycosyltransferase involved in cell wall biosynthesis